MAHPLTERRRAYNRAYWQANKHHYPPDTPPPGQWLAHCGAWQPLTQLPHTCPQCGARFFEKEAPHAA